MSGPKAWRRIWPWALAALVSALLWLADPEFFFKLAAVAALGAWWFWETLRPEESPSLWRWLDARKRRREERAFVAWSRARQAEDGGQSSETRSKPDLSGPGPGPGNCVVYPKPKRRARR